MPNPICPVCGEEMKYNALKYHKCWSCFQDNHGFTGPADDEYGDATRAMIETMRQEARIAELERENALLKEAVSQTTAASVSAVCRATHYQACNVCDDAECSDNANPSIVSMKKKIAELERKISELEGIIKVQDACLDELDAARDRMKLMPEIDAIYPGHAGTIQLLEDLNEGLERDLASAINRCRELTQLLNAERLQSGDELRVKIAGLEEKLAGLE